MVRTSQRTEPFTLVCIVHFLLVFLGPKFAVFLGDFDSAGVRTGLGHLEVTFWMLIAEALY